MTTTEIHHIYRQIINYLETNKLKETFENLRNLILANHLGNFNDDLSELETNYKYMLHYLEGAPQDPNQKKIYHQLLRKTYELTENVIENLFLKDASTLYFEKKRFANVRHFISLEEYQNTIVKQMDTFSIIGLMDAEQDKSSRWRENAQLHENTVKDLFYTIYISERATDEDIKSYHSFIQDENIIVDDKCMLISALTLNVMQRFDSRKIEFLLEMSVHDIMQIGIRSIIGCLIILQKYHKRWHLYPDCENRMKLLSDNPTFVNRCMNAILQLIQSRDTEKITKKLTEEIIPEMMKISPIIGKKINFDEWMGESNMDEKNPEWQKIFDDAGITNKMQEFSDLQMEGADVFHSTFSNLKTFPFFYEMSNWFLPFNPDHTQITHSGENNDAELYSMLKVSPFLCNSDKYSLSLSMMMMPENYRAMIINQMGAESKDIQEIMNEESILRPNQEEDRITKQYIQDLYRFYKVFVRKNEFQDIFTLPLNFHTILPLYSIIENPRNLEKIALYYFEKNHFREALSAYMQLSNIRQADSEIWQKIGYSYQQLGNIEKALDAYLKADLFLGDNTWVIRRIAQCYRMLNKPEKALEQYIRLQQLKPDDMNIQMQIGHSYLSMKDYDKALNSYFKVEMIGGDNPKAWRSIAWASFLFQKWDVASRYYQLILDKNPSVQDYLNAGHVALCQQNYKDAIRFYSSSASMAGNVEAFAKLLFEDAEELEKSGVNKEVLQLIIDKISYELRGEAI